MWIGLAACRSGLVRLRVDDDIGQEKVVVPGVLKIESQGGRARRVVVAKRREPHPETCQRRRNVIRRPADHATRKHRPSFDGLAAPDQVAVGLWKQPRQIDSIAACGRPECHLCEIFRRRLKIIQAGGGADYASKATVRCDISDFASVDVDRTVVAQTRKIGISVSGHGGLRKACRNPTPGTYPLQPEFMLKSRVDED